MALKRKLQIVLDSVAPEIHNLWLRPIKDFKWELSFFNGSVWRPVVAAPTAHDHVVGDITNFPTSLPASDVSSWAKAETKPSYTFSEIGSHPTTLSGYGITDATPSSHIGSTGNSHGVATSEVNGFMSTEDKIKLTNIAENANNYLHPDSHPATIITQTSDYRFVTDTEKGVWNGKEDVSNKKTDLTANSDTYYPSQKAVNTAINAAIANVWEMNPILAEIISILTVKINALEDLLSGNLGDIEVNNLTINQGLNIHGSEGNNVLTGTTAPADIPDHVFQGYVNTATGDLYISKNNTAVSDWVKIN